MEEASFLTKNSKNEWMVTDFKRNEGRIQRAWELLEKEKSKCENDPRGGVQTASFARGLENTPELPIEDRWAASMEELGRVSRDLQFYREINGETEFRKTLMNTGVEPDQVDPTMELFNGHLNSRFKPQGPD